VLLGAVTSAGTRPLQGLGVGIRTDAPRAALEVLAAAPPMHREAIFVVAFPAELDGSADAAAADAVAAAGALPWISARFRTPPPLEEHEEGLASELEALAVLLEDAPDGTVVQVVWRSGPPDWSQYAYLLKRVAVTVSAVRPGGLTATAALPPDPAALEVLFAHDAAAYADIVTLAPAPAEALEPLVRRLADLDPGAPVVVDGVAIPGTVEKALPLAARHAAAGAAVTLFDMPSPHGVPLAPLVVLAGELAGDVVFDPYLAIAGDGEAWAFVRGGDLALRIVATAEDGRLALRLGDASLERAERVALDGDGAVPVPWRHQGDALEIEVELSGAVALLRVARRAPGGGESFAGEIDVTAASTLPVDVILRRLQAFEAAQARRLESWRAHNTTHLRFRPTSGRIDTVEVTIAGPLFVDPAAGSDWVWRRFAINGVRWRSERIPQIPLIQPDRAAALPLVIRLDRRYRYRLRGSEMVRGRQCWAVDFAPVEGGAGENLWRGTVWIDRELYARVRSRAVQVGLEGEVVANEETIDFHPVAGDGGPVQWSADAWVLPLEVTAWQLQAILGATLQVERETLLSDVRVNSAGFEEARAEAWASPATMVRDTAAGLRYLEPTDEGARRVVEGFDADHLFLLGGAFYDDSVDFPLPLAGLDWFTLDLAGTGAHGNLFFAGVVVDGAVSWPDAFGTRWQVGAHLGGLLYPLEETMYRDGEEVDAEAVKHAGAVLGVSASRALGSRFKLDLSYDLGYDVFREADNADRAFVVPRDTFSHSIGVEIAFSRGGWVAAVGGSSTRRQRWDPWGLPGDVAYDPAQRDFLRWRAALARTWWLGPFKAGLQLEHLDGDDLDRFSAHDFGFFGGSRVAGYPRGLVRAERADGLHLEVAVGLAELLQLGVNGDVVRASDGISDLDDEVLAGVSVAGTIVGPWETLVRFDLGVPLAGPADGIVVQLLFLRRLR
jgi:hypothetical protein